MLQQPGGGVFPEAFEQANRVFHKGVVAGRQEHPLDLRQRFFFPLQNFIAQQQRTLPGASALHPAQQFL